MSVRRESHQSSVRCLRSSSKLRIAWQVIELLAWKHLTIDPQKRWGRRAEVWILFGAFIHEDWWTYRNGGIPWQQENLDNIIKWVWACPLHFVLVEEDSVSPVSIRRLTKAARRKPQADKSQWNRFKWNTYESSSQTFTPNANKAQGFLCPEMS